MPWAHADGEQHLEIRRGGRHEAHHRLPHQEEGGDEAARAKASEGVGLEPADVRGVVGLGRQVEELDVTATADLGQVLAELGDVGCAASQADQRVHADGLRRPPPGSRGAARTGRSTG